MRKIIRQEALSSDGHFQRLSGRGEWRRDSQQACWQSERSDRSGFRSVLYSIWTGRSYQSHRSKPGEGKRRFLCLCVAKPAPRQPVQSSHVLCVFLGMWQRPWEDRRAFQWKGAVSVWVTRLCRSFTASCLGPFTFSQNRRFFGFGLRQRNKQTVLQPSTSRCLIPFKPQD